MRFPPAPRHRVPCIFPIYPPQGNRRLCLSLWVSPLPLQLSPPLPAGRWNRYCRDLCAGHPPLHLLRLWQACNQNVYLQQGVSRCLFLYPPGRKPPSCPAPPPLLCRSLLFPIPISAPP